MQTLTFSPLTGRSDRKTRGDAEDAMMLLMHQIVTTGNTRDSRSSISLHTKLMGCWEKMMPCFLCLSTENTSKCDQCGSVFTCKDHVKRHMSSSGACYPYRVQYDCEMGRYLVAAKKIKQGKVILHEDPLVLGPYTSSKPQCLIMSP